jgi:YVTN family beta-propeller protein
MRKLLHSLVLLPLITLASCEGATEPETQVLPGKTQFDVQTQASGISAFLLYVLDGPNRQAVIFETANHTGLATTVDNLATHFNAGPWAIAITPDGLFAYVTVGGSGANEVTVIDMTTNLVAEHIPVGDRPRGVAITPDGSKVYVANWGGPTVSVISTTTNDVVATVNVAEGPRGLDMTPDGSSVYVASTSGTVSVIETASNTVSSTFSSYWPNDVVITPDGAYAYVVNFGSNRVSVFETVGHTLTATIEVGTLPQSAAITPDGDYVYVCNSIDGTVSVIETASNSVVATVPVVGYANFVAVRPDGAFVYATGSHSVSVIETATNNVVVTIPAVWNSGGLAITPSQTTIFPKQLIEGIVFRIDQLTPHWLENSHSNGLTAKLREAIRKLDQGQVKPAINKLGDFIDKVEGFTNSGVLAPEHAAYLKHAAQSVIDLLST